MRRACSVSSASSCHFARCGLETNCRVYFSLRRVVVLSSDLASVRVLIINSVRVFRPLSNCASRSCSDRRQGVPRALFLFRVLAVGRHTEAIIIMGPLSADNKQTQVTRGNSNTETSNR